MYKSGTFTKQDFQPFKLALILNDAIPRNGFYRTVEGWNRPLSP